MNHAENLCWTPKFLSEENVLIWKFSLAYLKY